MSSLWTIQKAIAFDTTLLNASSRRVFGELFYPAARLALCRSEKPRQNSLAALKRLSLRSGVREREQINPSKNKIGPYNEGFAFIPSVP